MGQEEVGVLFQSMGELGGRFDFGVGVSLVAIVVGGGHDVVDDVDDFGVERRVSLATVVESAPLLVLSLTRGWKAERSRVLCEERSGLQLFLSGSEPREHLLAVFVDGLFDIVFPLILSVGAGLLQQHPDHG